MAERGCNMGAIIWVIIVIWVVVALSKGKSPKGSQNARPMNTMQQKARSNEKNNPGWQQGAPRSGEKTAGQQNLGDWQQEREKWMTPEERQRELKARLAKKYSRQTDSSILERAKASVAEDKSRTGDASMAAGPVTGKDGTTDGAGVSAPGMEAGAWMISSDISQTASKLMPDDFTSDTMKEIENLMIMGPDTSIAFERDFVSEGLDMLNQIQV